MANAKKAVKKTATPTATSGTKAAKRAADCSCAAAKKVTKKAAKQAVPKPELETRKVCFTDKETGKRFCGEVTEVVKEKSASKVGAISRRRRRR